MKGKPVPSTHREKPPCTGCTERFSACSDRCPKDERGDYGYLAWKAKVKGIEDKRKAYYDILHEYRRKKRWRAEDEN
jgi:hypothetical protein